MVKAAKSGIQIGGLSDVNLNKESNGSKTSIRQPPPPTTDPDKKARVSESAVIRQIYKHVDLRKNKKGKKVLPPIRHNMTQDLLVNLTAAYQFLSPLKFIAKKFKEIKIRNTPYYKRAKLLNKFLDDLNEGLDLQSLVKKEFLRLHRQYRVMEEQAHTVLRHGNIRNRQERLLQLLNFQIEDMSTDLYRAEENSWVNLDNLTQNSLIGALEEIEAYKASEEEAIKMIREMGKNVDKISELLLAHKLHIKAIYNSGRAKQASYGEKKKAVLENRLHQKMTKYNSKLYLNKNLRDEIQSSLRLRSSYYERMNMLKRQLYLIKSSMGDVVYCATQHYENRDQMMQKVRQLRDREEKATRSHVLEIKEQRRVIDHDFQSRNFLRIKNSEREVQETGIQRKHRRNYLKFLEASHILISYNRAFKLILHEMEMEDEELDSILSHYLETESRNFGLFCRITDLNQEVLAQVEDVKEAALEIEQFYSLLQINEREREEILEELRVNIDNLIEENASLEDSYREEKILIEETMKILDDIIRDIGADTSLLNLLEYKDQVIPNTAILAIKSIETRARELKELESNLKAKKIIQGSRHSGSILKHGDREKIYTSDKYGGPYEPNVIVSVLEDDEDRFLVPMSYEQARDFIIEKLPAHLKVGRENVNATSSANALPSFNALNMTDSNIN